MVPSLVKMGRGKKFYGKKGWAEATTTSTNHKAKTPGLEDVVFTFGKAKDAVVFEITKSELVEYVGVQSWRGAADAALALETLVKQATLSRPSQHLHPRIGQSPTQARMVALLLLSKLYQQMSWN